MKWSFLIITSLLNWQALAADAGDTVPAAPSLTTQVELKSPAGSTFILANSLQQSLYVFDPDQDAGKPACNGKCAEVWPPITLSTEEIAALNNPDLGVQKRDSGLNQLTFKGRPVYLFNLDRTVGDIKGDGIGGVWHIISL